MSSEPIQKYAYAEVIEGGQTESWFLPLLEKAGIQKTESATGSQAATDEKTGPREWVEPRLRFADLISWLDMNVWHKRCVYAKAAVTVGLGWRLVTDDENKEIDDTHKRITEFLQQPNENPLDSFSQIAFKALVDYEALGNFFLETSQTLGGELGRLYHNRAVNFRVGRKRNSGYWQVPLYDYGTRTNAVRFNRFGDRTEGRNQILHYYQYDPAHDFYGMPVWVPSLADMVLDRSSVEFNINLFRNQLVAKFAVIVEGGKLSPESKQGLREFLASQATGTKNAGRTLIFDVDDPNVKVKIEKLEMNFGDKNDFMGKTRDSSRDMVVSSHGVPPRIVGIVTAGQLGGGSEAKEQLIIFEEIDRAPERSRIEAFFNRTILKPFGNHKWKIKFNGIDTTDAKLDADIAVLLKQNGIILPEEAREDLSKPALDEEGMNRLAGAGGMLTGLEENLSRVEKLRKQLENDF